MFAASDFSDDDAPAPDILPESPVPLKQSQQQRLTSSSGGVSGTTRERSRTLPTKVQSSLQDLLHRPSDPEFTPVTLARRAISNKSGGGAGVHVDAMGDAWAQGECRCLRCEILRLGATAAAADDILVQARGAVGAGQPPSLASGTQQDVAAAVGPGEKSSRSELSSAAAGTIASNGGRRRRHRSETPAAAAASVAAVSAALRDPSTPRPLLVLDLDNFGFPQMKAAAPASLMRLVASGRVLVWALYGVGFKRFFGTDAREYVARIPVRDPVRTIGRVISSAACGLGVDGAPVARRPDRGGAESAAASSSSVPQPKRRAGRKSGRGGDDDDAAHPDPAVAEGTAASTAGPSAWAVLKAAHVLLLSPCGAHSQAADGVVLDAAWLASPDRSVVVATGDRGLQREVAALATGGRCRVVPTNTFSDAAALWNAVEAAMVSS